MCGSCACSANPLRSRLCARLLLVFRCQWLVFPSRKPLAKPSLRGADRVAVPAIYVCLPVAGAVRVITSFDHQITACCASGRCVLKKWVIRSTILPHSPHRHSYLYNSIFPPHWSHIPLIALPPRGWGCVPGRGGVGVIISSSVPLHRFAPHRHLRGGAYTHVPGGM